MHSNDLFWDILEVKAALTIIIPGTFNQLFQSTKISREVLILTASL